MQPTTQTAEYPPAPVPRRPTSARLRTAIAGCRACDLWKPATQAVLGEGPHDREVMLVGEQPGDREDIEGRPFVGPAGVVLDRALERAGLSRSAVYVTNVVKHFRYTQRGKRRIHERPTRWQVSACLPWFEAELELVRPDALVCLGATAAQALLGREVRIGRERGRQIASDLARIVTVTAHPSAILRMRGHAEREHAMGLLVSDLAAVAAWHKQAPPS